MNTLIQPKTFDIETFAVDVLQWRTKENLSRPAMLRMIGYDGAYILQHIETYKYTPTIDIVFNLCELMGKPIGDYMK